MMKSDKGIAPASIPIQVLAKMFYDGFESFFLARVGLQRTTLVGGG
jgi:hypothetical protein